jgi:hypothetical protein
MPHEFFAVVECKKGIVQVYLGDPRHRAQQDVFDTRLRGRSHGNRVSVAAQSSSYPKDIDFSNRVETIESACLAERIHPPAHSGGNASLGAPLRYQPANFEALVLGRAGSPSESASA